MRVPARVATALLAALTLVGCSSAVAEQKSRSGGQGAAGGTLVAAIGTDLVPAQFYSGLQAASTIAGLTYESLIDYPVDSLEPQPSLAASWKLAEDGLSLTLDLQPEATFQTGRDLTSDDVKFSLQTYADPARAAQLQRTAAAITSYDTSDPDRIVLGFDHPVSNIFDLLDQVPIIDRESIAGFDSGTKYVGTGPFTFDSWTPNSRLEFSRYDDYWGEKALLDEVEVRVIKDSTSQISALRSGQVDVVLGAPARDLEQLERSGEFRAERLTGAEADLYVGTNVTHPALAEVEVRQAIAYAIDKRRIAEEVYRDRARAHDLPWPEYSPAYDPELDQRYARDVAKAAELLDGRRVPTLPLAYMAGNPNHEAAAQIVQANLAEVGVETELQPVETSQFLKQLIGAEFEALWVTEHTFAQYTPSTLTVSAYPFNADGNASRFVDADYQRAADAAWKVADGTGAEASRRYAELSRQLLEHLFLIELVETTQEHALSSAVDDIAWSKRGEIDLARTTVSR